MRTARRIDSAGINLTPVLFHQMGSSNQGSENWLTGLGYNTFLDQEMFDGTPVGYFQIQKPFKLTITSYKHGVKVGSLDCLGEAKVILRGKFTLDSPIQFPLCNWWSAIWPWYSQLIQGTLVTSSLLMNWMVIILKTTYGIFTLWTSTYIFVHNNYTIVGTPTWVIFFFQYPVPFSQQGRTVGLGGWRWDIRRNCCFV